MIVKMFTMVKDEEDIIEYWINYHGSIFGYGISSACALG